MPLPHTFGNAVSPELFQNLDDNFNYVGRFMTPYCGNIASSSGVFSITTPVAWDNYTTADYSLIFRAINTGGAFPSANINGLGGIAMVNTATNLPFSSGLVTGKTYLLYSTGTGSSVALTVLD